MKAIYLISNGVLLKIISLKSEERYGTPFNVSESCLNIMLTTFEFFPFGFYTIIGGWLKKSVNFV